ncbi:MAG: VWA domain-containing protein [Roseibium sp.]|uniref:VWA domain-containing protein n=1 Tax=Roseibium sp. TaxID=1936156 RepID=UPI0026340E0A|nr:VWA domain-containing protein [Roseibium sp.]MCV0426432.1 VWA domain-containing protein [Roseibium sp.]
MAKTSGTKKDGLVHQTTKVPSAASDISAFLEKAKELKAQPGSGGRLIFALDATMSRQPTWDQACHIQAEMFQEAGKIGGLKIKLVYFRGFGECKSSRWFEHGEELANAMGRIACQGGRTQIRKVLTAALATADKEKIAALVYVGDCMEEDVDILCDKAGELGLRGVPMFLFQEGRDTVAEQAFREMARLTNGVYCPFDAGSAQQLAELLKAVAVFASGGHTALQALEKKGGRGARLLLEQLKSAK